MNKKTIITMIVFFLISISSVSAQQWTCSDGTYISECNSDKKYCGSENIILNSGFEVNDDSNLNVPDEFIPRGLGVSIDRSVYGRKSVKINRQDSGFGQNVDVRAGVKYLLHAYAFGRCEQTAFYYNHPRRGSRNLNLDKNFPYFNISTTYAPWYDKEAWQIITLNFVADESVTLRNLRIECADRDYSGDIWIDAVHMGVLNENIQPPLVDNSGVCGCPRDYKETIDNKCELIERPAEHLEVPVTVTPREPVRPEPTIPTIQPRPVEIPVEPIQPLARPVVGKVCEDSTPRGTCNANFEYCGNTNLIPNPGFEIENQDNPNLPAYFTRDGSLSINDIYFDKTQAYKGQNSIKISRQWHSFDTKERIILDTNTDYIFTAYVKGECSSYRLYSSKRDNTAYPASTFGTPEIREQGEWKKLKYVFNSKEFDNNFLDKLRLECADNNPEFWVDAMHLERKQKNIVLNPGFEVRGTLPLPSEGNTIFRPDNVVDSWYRRCGDNCQGIGFGLGWSAFGNYNHRVKVDSALGNWNGGITSKRIQLKPNTQYRFTGYTSCNDCTTENPSGSDFIFAVHVVKRPTDDTAPQGKGNKHCTDWDCGSPAKISNSNGYDKWELTFTTRDEQGLYAYVIATFRPEAAGIGRVDGISIEEVNEQPELLDNNCGVCGCDTGKECDLNNRCGLTSVAETGTVIRITADDSYSLYLNNHLVGQSDDPSIVDDFIVELQPGENVIGIYASERDPLDSKMGAIAEIYNNGNLIAWSDRTWKARRNPTDSWRSRNIDYDDSEWEYANELETSVPAGFQKAKWIWGRNNVGAHSYGLRLALDNNPETGELRQALSAAKVATVRIKADDQYTLSVGDSSYGSAQQQSEYEEHQIILQPGDNIVGILSNEITSNGPEGLLAEILVDGELIAWSDRTWDTHFARGALPEGWRTDPEFDISEWETPRLNTGRTLEQRPSAFTNAQWMWGRSTVDGSWYFFRLVLNYNEETGEVTRKIQGGKTAVVRIKADDQYTLSVGNSQFGQRQQDAEYEEHQIILQPGDNIVGILSNEITSNGPEGLLAEISVDGRVIAWSDRTWDVHFARGEIDLEWRTDPELDVSEWETPGLNRGKTLDQRPSAFTNAQWMWGRSTVDGSWYFFRLVLNYNEETGEVTRKVQGGKTAVVRIKADDQYTLSVGNSQFGQRQQGAEYEEHQIILQPGDNVIGILSNEITENGPEGLLAEILVDGELIAWSDKTWNANFSRGNDLTGPRTNPEIHPSDWETPRVNEHREPSERPSVFSNAQWMWGRSTVDGSWYFFRLVLNYNEETGVVRRVVQQGKTALIRIAAKDSYSLAHNNKFIGQGTDSVDEYNVVLDPGRNTIGIYAGAEEPLGNEGFISEILVDDEIITQTDNTWKAKRNPQGDDWRKQNINFDDSLWENPIEQDTTIPIEITNGRWIWGRLTQGSHAYGFRVVLYYDQETGVVRRVFPNTCKDNTPKGMCNDNFEYCGNNNLLPNSGFEASGDENIPNSYIKDPSGSVVLNTDVMLDTEAYYKGQNSIKLSKRWASFDLDERLILDASTNYTFTAKVSGSCNDYRLYSTYDDETYNICSLGTCSLIGQEFWKTFKAEFNSNNFDNEIVERLRIECADDGTAWIDTMHLERKQKNLVQNPGFEFGSHGQTEIPVGWNNNSRGQPDETFSLDWSSFGIYLAKISVTNSPGWYGLKSDPIKLKPNTQYKLKGLIYSPDTEDFVLTLHVRPLENAEHNFYCIDNKCKDNKNIIERHEHGYDRWEITFTTLGDEELDGKDLYAHIIATFRPGATGTARVDGISLEEVYEQPELFSNNCGVCGCNEGSFCTEDGTCEELPEICLDLNLDRTIDDIDKRIIDQCLLGSHPNTALCIAAELYPEYKDYTEKQFNELKGTQTDCSEDIIQSLELSGDLSFFSDAKENYCPRPNRYEDDVSECIQHGKSYFRTDGIHIVTVLDGTPLWNKKLDECETKVYCRNVEVGIWANNLNDNYEHGVVYFQKDGFQDHLHDYMKSRPWTWNEFGDVCLSLNDAENIPIPWTGQFVDPADERKWEGILEVIEQYKESEFPIGFNSREAYTDGFPNYVYLTSEDPQHYEGLCFGYYAPSMLICRDDVITRNSCDDSEIIPEDYWEVTTDYWPGATVSPEIDLTTASIEGIGKAITISVHPLSSSLEVVSKAKETYPDNMQNFKVQIQWTYGEDTGEHSDNKPHQFRDLVGEFSGDIENGIARFDMRDAQKTTRSFNFHDKGFCYINEELVENCVLDEVTYTFRARLLGPDDVPKTRWGYKSIKVDLLEGVIPPYIEMIRQIQVDHDDNIFEDAVDLLSGQEDCYDYPWMGPGIVPLREEYQNLGLTNDIRWRFKPDQLDQSYFFQVQYSNDGDFWIDVPGASELSSDDPDFYQIKNIKKPKNSEDLDFLYKYSNIGEITYKGNAEIREYSTTHIGTEKCILSNINLYQFCRPFEGVERSGWFVNKYNLDKIKSTDYTDEEKAILSSNGMLIGPDAGLEEWNGRCYGDQSHDTAVNYRGMTIYDIAEISTRDNWVEELIYNEYDNCLPEGPYVYRIRAIDDKGHPLSHWGLSDYIVMDYDKFTSPMISKKLMASIDHHSFDSYRDVVPCYRGCLYPYRIYSLYDIDTKYRTDEDEAPIAMGCSRWNAFIDVVFDAALVYVSFQLGGALSEQLATAEAASAITTMSAQEAAFLQNVVGEAAFQEIMSAAASQQLNPMFHVFKYANTLVAFKSRSSIANRVSNLVCEGSNACQQIILSLAGWSTLTEEEFVNNVVWDWTVRNTKKQFDRLCSGSNTKGLRKESCDIAFSVAYTKATGIQTKDASYFDEYISPILKRRVVEWGDEEFCKTKEFKDPQQIPGTEAQLSRNLCRSLIGIAYDDGVKTAKTRQKDSHERGFIDQLKGIPGTTYKTGRRFARRAFNSQAREWGTGDKSEYVYAVLTAPLAIPQLIGKVADQPGALLDYVGDIDWAQIDIGIIDNIPIGGISGKLDFRKWNWKFWDWRANPNPTGRSSSAHLDESTLENLKGHLQTLREFHACVEPYFDLADTVGLDISIGAVNDYSDIRRKLDKEFASIDSEINKIINDPVYDSLHPGQKNQMRTTLRQEYGYSSFQEIDNIVETYVKNDLDDRTELDESIENAKKKKNSCKLIDTQIVETGLLITKGINTPFKAYVEAKIAPVLDDLGVSGDRITRIIRNSEYTFEFQGGIIFNVFENWNPAELHTTKYNLGAALQLLYNDKQLEDREFCNGDDKISFIDLKRNAYTDVMHWIRKIAEGPDVDRYDTTEDWIDDTDEWLEFLNQIDEKVIKTERLLQETNFAKDYYKDLPAVGPNADGIFYYFAYIAEENPQFVSGRRQGQNIFDFLIKNYEPYKPDLKIPIKCEKSDETLSGTGNVFTLKIGEYDVQIIGITRDNIEINENEHKECRGDCETWLSFNKADKEAIIQADETPLKVIIMLDNNIPEEQISFEMPARTELAFKDRSEQGLIPLVSLYYLTLGSNEVFFVINDINHIVSIDKEGIITGTHVSTEYSSTAFELELTKDRLILSDVELRDAIFHYDGLLLRETKEGDSLENFNNFWFIITDDGVYEDEKKLVPQLSYCEQICKAQLCSCPKKCEGDVLFRETCEVRWQDLDKDKTLYVYMYPSIAGEDKELIESAIDHVIETFGSVGMVYEARILDHEYEIPITPSTSVLSGQSEINLGYTGRILLFGNDADLDFEDDEEPGEHSEMPTIKFNYGWDGISTVKSNNGQSEFTRFLASFISHELGHSFGLIHKEIESGGRFQTKGVMEVNDFSPLSDGNVILNIGFLGFNYLDAPILSEWANYQMSPSLEAAQSLSEFLFLQRDPEFEYLPQMEPEFEEIFTRDMAYRWPGFVMPIMPTGIKLFNTIPYTIAPQQHDEDCSPHPVSDYVENNPFEVFYIQHTQSKEIFAVGIDENIMTIFPNDCQAGISITLPSTTNEEEISSYIDTLETEEIYKDTLRYYYKVNSEYDEIYNQVKSFEDSGNYDSAIARIQTYINKHPCIEGGSCTPRSMDAYAVSARNHLRKGQGLKLRGDYENAAASITTALEKITFSRSIGKIPTPMIRDLTAEVKIEASRLLIAGFGNAATINSLTTPTSAAVKITGLFSWINKITGLSILVLNPATTDQLTEAERLLTEVMQEESAHFDSALYASTRLPKEVSYYETLKTNIETGSGQFEGVELSDDFKDSVLPHFDFVIAYRYKEEGEYWLVKDSTREIDIDENIRTPTGRSVRELLLQLRFEALTELGFELGFYDDVEEEGLLPEIVRYTTNGLGQYGDPNEQARVMSSLVTNFYEVWATKLAETSYNDKLGQMDTEDRVDDEFWAETVEFHAEYMRRYVDPKLQQAIDVYEFLIPQQYNRELGGPITISEKTIDPKVRYQALMRYAGFLERTKGSAESMLILQNFVSQFEGREDYEEFVEQTDNYVRNLKTTTLKSFFQLAQSSRAASRESRFNVDSLFYHTIGDDGSYEFPFAQSDDYQRCFEDGELETEGLSSALAQEASGEESDGWFSNPCWSAATSLFGTTLNSFTPMSIMQTFEAEDRETEIIQANLRGLLVQTLAFKLLNDTFENYDTLQGTWEALLAPTANYVQNRYCYQHYGECEGDWDDYKMATLEHTYLCYAHPDGRYRCHTVCKRGSCSIRGVIGLKEFWVGELDFSVNEDYTFGIYYDDLIRFLDPRPNTEWDYEWRAQQNWFLNLFNAPGWDATVSNWASSFLNSPVLYAEDYNGNSAVRYLLALEDGLEEGTDSDQMNRVKLEMALQYRDNRQYRVARQLMEEVAIAGYQGEIEGRTASEWIDFSSGGAFLDFTLGDETVEGLNPGVIMQSFTNPAYAIAGGMLLKTATLPLKGLARLPLRPVLWAVRAARITQQAASSTYQTFRAVISKGFTYIQGRGAVRAGQRFFVKIGQKKVIGEFVVRDTGRIFKVVGRGSLGVTKEGSEEVAQAAIEEYGRQINPFFAVLVSAMVPARSHFRGEVNLAMQNIDNQIDYSVMGQAKLADIDFNAESELEQPLDLGSDELNIAELRKKASYLFAKNFELEGKPVNYIARDGLESTTVTEVVAQNGERTINGETVQVTRGSVILENGVVLSDITEFRQQVDLEGVTFESDYGTVYDVDAELSNWVTEVAEIEQNMRSSPSLLDAEADAELRQAQSMTQEEALRILDQGTDLEAVASLIPRVNANPDLTTEDKVSIVKTAALVKRESGIDITRDLTEWEKVGAPAWVSNQITKPVAEQLGISRYLEGDGITVVNPEGESVTYSEHNCNLCTWYAGGEDGPKGTVMSDFIDIAHRMTPEGTDLTDAQLESVNQRLVPLREFVKDFDRNGVITELDRSHIEELLLRLGDKQVPYEYQRFVYNEVEGDPKTQKIGIRLKRKNSDKPWLPFVYNQETDSWMFWYDPKSKDKVVRKHQRLIEEGKEPTELKLLRALHAKRPEWKVLDVKASDILGKTTDAKDIKVVNAKIKKKDIDDPDVTHEVDFYMPKKRLFDEFIGQDDVTFHDMATGAEVEARVTDMNLLINRFVAYGEVDIEINPALNKYDILVSEQPIIGDSVADVKDILELSELIRANGLANYQVPVMVGVVDGRAVLIYDRDEDGIRLTPENAAEVRERIAPAENVDEDTKDAVADAAEQKIAGEGDQDTVEAAAAAESVDSTIDDLFRDDGEPRPLDEYMEEHTLLGELEEEDLLDPTSADKSRPARDYLIKKPWLILFNRRPPIIPSTDLTRTAEDFFSEHPELLEGGILDQRGSDGKANRERTLKEFLERHPGYVLKIWDMRFDPDSVVEIYKRRGTTLSSALRLLQAKGEIESDTDINNDVVRRLEQEALKFISKRQGDKIVMINEFYTQLDGLVKDIKANNPGIDLTDITKPTLLNQLDTLPGESLLRETLERTILIDIPLFDRHITPANLKTVQAKAYDIARRRSQAGTAMTDFYRSFDNLQSALGINIDKQSHFIEVLTGDETFSQLLRRWVDTNQINIGSNSDIMPSGIPTTQAELDALISRMEELGGTGSTFRTRLGEFRTRMEAEVSGAGVTSVDFGEAKITDERFVRFAHVIKQRLLQKGITTIGISDVGKLTIGQFKAELDNAGLKAAADIIITELGDLNGDGTIDLTAGEGVTATVTEQGIEGTEVGDDITVGDAECSFCSVLFRKGSQEGRIRSAKSMENLDINPEANAQISAMNRFVAGNPNVATSFDELYGYLNTIDGVEGSSGFIPSSELRSIIDDIREGRLGIMAMTRANGLRDALPRLLITDAQGWDQLYRNIDAIGEIEGSAKTYTNVELKDIINRVRSGELDITLVTSSEGLRAKVEELLNPSTESDIDFQTDPTIETESSVVMSEFNSLGGTGNVRIVGEGSVANLEANNLLPATKVEYKGVKYFISQSYSWEGRKSIVVYVYKDGQFQARSAYKSNSQAMWRIGSHRLPGQYWIGKGLGEASTNVPFALQGILEDLSRDQVSLDNDNAMEIFYSLLRVRQAHDGPSDTFVGGIDINDWETVASFPGDQIKDVNGRDHGIPENFRYENEQKAPDFTNPAGYYTGHSPIYGEILAYRYPSLDGSLEYLFFKDSQDRVWLGGVERSDSGITLYGLNDKLILEGDHTMPLAEYTEQIPSGFIGESMSGHYSSAWPYLQRLPIIQEFYAQTGVTMPGVQISSVAEAQTFDQLYGYLDSVGSIEGASTTYTSAQLRTMIEEVRSGLRDSTTITRTDGLRTQVEALMASTEKILEADFINSGLDPSDYQFRVGINGERYFERIAA